MRFLYLLTVLLHYRFPRLVAVVIVDDRRLMLNSGIPIP